MCDEPQKILIVHLNQVGDLLFSLPALKALRERFAKAYLVSLVRPHLASLLNHNTLVDDIILRPKTYNPFRQIRLIKTLKAHKFDMAILFSQTHESVILCYLAGIPQRVGFTNSGLGFLLTQRIPKYGLPSIQNNLRLVEALGAKVNKPDYVGLLNISEGDKEYVQDLLKNYNLQDQEPLIAFSPGASRRRSPKSWAAEKFAKLADELINKYQAKIIFTGTRGQLGMIQSIAQLMQTKPFIAAGKTSLGQLAALLERCHLFIGTDSGSMHLACAVKTPVIALFGPTNPEETGPRGQGNIIIKKQSMDLITVEEVLKAVDAQWKAKRFV